MLADGGKLIVTGDAGMIRLNADGSTDDPFGTSKGAVRLSGFSFEAQTQDSTNNIYLVGQASKGTVVLKYASDGTPDNTFGTRGSVLVTTDDNFVASSIAVQSDGKVLVGGTLTDSNTGDQTARVYRFNTNGNGDQPFGNQGAADIELGLTPVLTPDLHDKLLGIFVLPSGKIELAGGSVSTSEGFTAPDGNFIGGSFGDAVMVVARLNTDGSLDSTFNAGGFSRAVYADADTVTDVSQSNSFTAVLPSAVTFLPDGTVYLAAFDTSTVVKRFGPSGKVAFTARPDTGTPIRQPVDMVGLSGGRVAILAQTNYHTEYGFAMATINSAGNFGNIVRTDDLNPDTPEFNLFSPAALAVSLDGKLLVAGESAEGGDFVVARYTPGTALDPRPDDFSNATVNQMVTDDAGALHLAYYDPSAKKLKYAYRAPNGLWNSSVTVDNSGSNGSYLSIALELVNKGTKKHPNMVQEPAITYFAATGADLKIAESTDLGQHFTVSTIASKGSVGLYPSLFFDSKNQATVTFYNRTTGDAFFGQRRAGVWHFETIDSAGDVGRNIQLAVDPNGIYTAAYVDVTHKTIKYAEQGKHGVWTSEVAATTKSGANYLSFEQNSSFGPAIAYFDNANSDVVLAYITKKVFKTVVLGGPLSQGLFNQLEFAETQPTVYAWNSSTDRITRYTDVFATPVSTSTIIAGGGNFLSAEFDGQLQEIAFVDTASNNLHVRFAEGPA